VLDLLLTHADLEPHDPWNEGREATLILRGRADVDATNALLEESGFPWCVVIDNGSLFRRPGHAYHLAPAGTGKAGGVAADRRHHDLAVDQVAYVGDSAADVACAPEVAACWLVANADPELDWSLRTDGSYGDGVAEVIDELLAG